MKKPSSASRYKTVPKLFLILQLCLFLNKRMIFPGKKLEEMHPHKYGADWSAETDWQGLCLTPQCNSFRQVRINSSLFIIPAPHWWSRGKSSLSLCSALSGICSCGQKLHEYVWIWNLNIDRFHICCSGKEGQFLGFLCNFCELIQGIPSWQWPGQGHTLPLVSDFMQVSFSLSLEVCSLLRLI